MRRHEKGMGSVRRDLDVWEIWAMDDSTEFSNDKCAIKKPLKTQVHDYGMATNGLVAALLRRTWGL